MSTVLFACVHNSGRSQVFIRDSQIRNIPFARFAICEYSYAVPLKPQDVLVLLHLALTPGKWTYPAVAKALGMSPSEVHTAVKRAQASGLFNAHSRQPARGDLLEFLTHGLRYVFPVERGGLARGIPTAYAAPPLKDRLAISPGDVPPVWPDPQGDTRGESWAPLYSSVPGAARNDPALYEVLALVDAIRGGRARERALAIEELTRRLSI